MTKARVSYRVLSIDPGTKITGWAVFEVDEIKHAGKYVCSSSIKYKPSYPKKGWLDRIEYMVARMINLVQSYGIDKVVIEQPEVFMRGRGVGASNSGAVVKLAGLVFAMKYAIIYSRKKRKAKVCQLVSVRKWKGNIPKEVTQRRIKKHLRLSITENNEADAVGLGSWYIKDCLGYRLG